MYVKVHKKGNQWFRDDNGALVGKDISFASTCAFEGNNKIFLPIYGYISSDGLFKKLCTCTSCSFTCLSECKENCRYTQKLESEGYYIVTD